MKALLALGLLAFGGCLGGCIAEGERRLSVSIAGVELSVHDKVETNQEGIERYRAGFDEESSVVRWFFPPPGTDETAKAEEGDEVEGG